MPELPRLLSEAAEAAERLRAAEASYDETRDEFWQGSNEHTTPVRRSP
jgi:hypothetical protein